MFDKIPDTIQSTRYLARKLATKFRFLALAAALAFLSLNLSASPLHDAVNAKDTIYGQTPLYWVESANILSRLIIAGADVHAKGNDGKTPLHIPRSVDAINALLAAGADVDAKDNDGLTTLHYVTSAPPSSSEEIIVDIMKTLLAAGADVHINDNEGRTPLDINTNWAAILKDLITTDSGIDDVNVKDENEDTRLHNPIDLETLNDLLIAGADVNAKNNEGQTSLHLAVRRNALLVYPLIAAGTDVNTKDNKSRTPLY